MDKKRTCVQFTADGKEYTLAFSRKSAARLEQMGFSMDRLAAGELITQAQLLFYGAFAKNHPRMTKRDSDTLWDRIANTEDLIAVLYELYLDVANEFIGEEDDESKNVTWTAK